MDLEKRRKFIINVLYFALVALISFGAIRYGLVWMLPFVLGFIVAFCLKPFIRLLNQKLKLKRKPAAALAVLLFYCTIGVLLAVVIVNLFIWVRDLFAMLPSFYVKTLEPAIYDLFGWVEGLFTSLDPQMASTIQEVASSFAKSLGSLVTSASTMVVGAVSGALTGVPGALLAVAFTIISSFFFAMDYDAIIAFVMRQFSPKKQEIILDAKNYMTSTLFKFLKAYSILMAITFAELALGLTILRVPNSFGIALLISIMDALPALGTGSILIPWLVIELIKGNVGMAIGLGIIYGIITVVRNILEPKIVGEQVGLHPLLMLICMFLGVRLFGFLGLFILPILVIIIKNLNETGKIRLYKS